MQYNDYWKLPSGARQSFHMTLSIKIYYKRPLLDATKRDMKF